jgi:hypothetical protein
MISASKTTFSHYNLKILRPKVTKNIKNLLKKFCKFQSRLITNKVSAALFGDGKGKRVMLIKRFINMKV